jgi:hypothetical protein
MRSIQQVEGKRKKYLQNSRPNDLMLNDEIKKLKK